MADLGGNYVNPDYATPEQLKQLRAQADQLIGASVAPTAKSKYGILAHALMGFAGNQGINNAANLERQAIGDVSRQDPVIQMLTGQAGGQPQQGGMPQSGQPVAPPAQQPSQAPSPGPSSPISSSPRVWGDKEAEAAGLYDSPNAQPRPVQTAQVPQNDFAARFSGFQHNPWANPDQQNLARALVTPSVGTDVNGTPTTTSVVAGQNKLPTGPGVVPGFRSEQTISPDSIHNTVVNPAPGFTGGTGGGGLDGAKRTMNELRQNSVVQGVGGDIVKQDMQFANEAQNVKKAVGTIIDNIKTYGDKMTFGPTAEWSQELKKGLANYAPGFMKDQMGAIAAADGMQKMSATLAGVLAKQMATGSGTDAGLANSLQSVPSLHNSKEGALALGNMIMQTADHQQEMARAVQGAKTPQEWLQLKQQYLASHPIINPVTNNPIDVDIAASKIRKGGGWSIEPVK